MCAQEVPLFVPANVFDSESDVSKYCALLAKKDNLDRKTIYNLASNGIIARSIQNNNLKYTQVRYNHMLLKLFSDAYFTCPEFTENYYFVFDAGNIENEELVAQHKLFSTKLLDYIQTNKSIKQLTNPELPILGYLEHSTERNYILSFYPFLPQSGTLVPNELNNLIARYNFALDGENVTLERQDINEEKLKVLVDKKSNPAPPPPPRPKRN